jgi:hypothetical protein
VDRRNHNPPRVLGFGINRVEFQAIWTPIYRGLALCRRGFDREAILILQSGLVTVRMGLIKRGRTSGAV